MKVEVCQRKKRTARGCYQKKNKAPELGTERAKTRALTKESDVMLREKEKYKRRDCQAIPRRLGWQASNGLLSKSKLHRGEA